MDSETAITMGYDTALADRIRRFLSRRRDFSEKRMFGGLGFLHRGNLAFALWKQSLVIRVGRERYDAALREPHVSEFDVTGRPMTGWILVAPAGLTSDADLKAWLERGLDFVRELAPKPAG